MNNENKEIIKATAIEIIKLMGFDGEVEILEEKEEEERVICNIRAKKDSNVLIGQGGDNLQALQHIIRLLVRKKTDDKVRFVLDVNSYKKDQEVSVLDLAQEMAQRAVDEKKTMIMRPMSAYNRRLVHMCLSDNEKVKTESIGENGERRVVIKPTSIL
ncbi:MAG: R3H domain-containing nucleic acid-binding protein [Candidatus Moraniibacteriota bacterium]